MDALLCALGGNAVAGADVPGAFAAFALILRFVVADAVVVLIRRLAGFADAGADADAEETS